MKSPRTHRLQIAGQPLTVRSSAETAYVEGLAASIEARVQPALDAGAGPAAAALLAALALADELKRAEDELAQIKAALAERVDALRAAVS